MRYPWVLVLLFASVGISQAHCCKRSCFGHHVSTPTFYSYPVVEPYWTPTVIWYQPMWYDAPNAAVAPSVPREQLPTPKPKADDSSLPRIRPPQLPTEDVTPRKSPTIPPSTPTPTPPAPEKKETPKAKEADKTKEKNVSVDQFLIPAERVRSEAPSEVKVGFFNHSDREMEIEINGETLKLPADQYVTVRLPRTFNWSVKGQVSKEVKVPADSDGLEIVFRR